MRTIVCLICILFLCSFANLKPQVMEEGIPVTITVTDLRPDESGFLVVSVYVKEDVFPNKPYKFFNVDKSVMIDGTLEYTFTVEKEGQYAISLLDDLNENLNIDTNFFGIPKEGYGFSRNARPRGFFPPKFEDAAFDVDSMGVNLTSRMYYFL